jgi:glycosyltransferase involved in cell wall biosynthesis
MRSIKGVALLRDEDLLIGWALGNLVDFCDHILVLNNCSVDRTGDIVRAFAAQHSHVEVIDVPDAYDTHRFVEPWAGEDHWVLKIDGDEVYDREGLARFRPRLLAGEFDHVWRVMGHSFHLTGGSILGTAVGHPSPPSKSVAFLTNFAAMDAWPSSRNGGNQRLCGQTAIRFRDGFTSADEALLYRTEPWEACDVRNLHFCFLPRSSRAPATANRLAPSEVLQVDRGVRGLVRSLFRRGTPPSVKKVRRYAQGDPVSRPLVGFGRPADVIDLDPHAREAEAALEAALASGSARIAA